MENNASTYHLYTVDKDTWENGEEIPYVFSASLDFTDSGLLQSGKFETEQPLNGYIRFEMIADTGNGSSRAEMATLLATTSSVKHTPAKNVYTCDCYSVLNPAKSETSLDIGWTFPTGGDPVAGALDLLKQNLDAPVAPMESTVRTSGSVNAEQNETALSMAHTLLEVAGYHLAIDGHGNVSARPDDVVLDTGINATSGNIGIEVVSEVDKFNVPNMIRLTDGKNWIEAVNDDESSDTSVQNMGYINGKYEKVDLAEGETLLDRAYSMLDEASRSTNKISYTRDYDPDINVGDSIRVYIPQAGIEGVFKVLTQSISIESSSRAVVSETASMVTDTFRR